jgi:hypothetical protein
VAQHLSSKPLNPKPPLQSFPTHGLSMFFPLLYASFVISAKIYKFKVITKLLTEIQVIFTLFLIYIYIYIYIYIKERKLGGDLATMLVSIGLHNFWLTSNLVVMGFDLGYWVKPWNTTWFFVFLFTKYDDNHWIYKFWMSKSILFEIANQLRLLIRKDTRYYLGIHVEVHVTWFEFVDLCIMNCLW